MTGHTTRALLVAAALAGAGGSGRAEPLAPHPAAAAAAVGGWNAQMGRFGESLVREAHRARGEQVFDLNVRDHGIDGLVRTTGPDGRPAFRVIEVKTLQDGTDFRLGETKAGRQLSPGWVEERLATAAKTHPDDAARRAAAEALGQFRAAPAAVKAELHGVSVGQNRYVVRAVDAATGATREVSSTRVTDLLDDLATRAGAADVRQAAARHRDEFGRLQAAAKPRVAAGDVYVRDLARVAGAEERATAAALKEASEHVTAPGQAKWVNAGGKVFRFVGRAAGPAGVVVGVAVFTAEAAGIEQRVERGELTREQGDAEHARLAARTGVEAGGALGGMAAGATIGTFLCPGVGTVAGGVVGAVAGCLGADLVLAADGVTDALGGFLEPGADAVRAAAGFVRERGAVITLAARDQVRQWVGAEGFDEAAAAVGSAAGWAGDLAGRAGAAVRDAAVGVRDAAADGAAKVGESVSAGASWAWGAGVSGWDAVRRRFE